MSSVSGQNNEHMNNLGGFVNSQTILEGSQSSPVGDDGVPGLVLAGDLQEVLDGLQGGRTGSQTQWHPALLLFLWTLDGIEVYFPLICNFSSVVRFGLIASLLLVTTEMPRLPVLSWIC